MYSCKNITTIRRGGTRVKLSSNTRVNLFSKTGFLLVVGLLMIAGISSWLYYDHTRNNEKAEIQTYVIKDVARNGSLTIDGGSRSFDSSVPLQADQNQLVVYTADPVQVKKNANAAVITWNQSGNTGVKLDVRTRNDQAWSDWTPINPLDGGKEGTEQQGEASSIVTANHIDEFQFRVQLQGESDGPSSTVDISNSSLLTIDSSKGPSGKKSLIDKLSYALSPTVSASTSGPRIISRAEWGNPQPNWSEWPPEYEPVSRAIIHHTATTESSNPYADVRAIWEYHAHTLQWGDIGYNYLIDSHGNIFQGRYYDQNHANRYRVDVVAGHAYGNNRGTIGISMIGDYRYKSPTYQTLDSLNRIVGYKLAPYDLDVAGSGPKGEVVVGHFQVGQTSCPGINLINRLGETKHYGAAYYRQYKPLFVFRSLITPRVMELTKNEYKYNADTLSQSSDVFPAGMQRRFVDKFEKNGEWYLRTEIDARNGIRMGIPLSSIKEISPVPIDPEWLRLTTPSRKYDPIRDIFEPSNVTYPTGMQRKFTSKIVVRGKTYYRTAYDMDNNNPWYYEDNRTAKVKYSEFVAPRWKRIMPIASAYDPFTSQRLDIEDLASKDVKFVSKVTTDRLYFRTESDTQAELPRGIPADMITEIPYQPINPDRSSALYSLSTDIQKYIPSEERAVGDTISKDSIIRFVDKITIAGKEYYRTTHDTAIGANLSIPASTLHAYSAESLSFIPMTEPRFMRTTSSTMKTNLNTFQPADPMITPHMRVKYTTKVKIGSEWYLQTEHDATLKQYLGVPLRLLQD